MNKAERQFRAETKAMNYRLSINEIKLIDLEQEQSETRLRLYYMLRPVVVEGTITELIEREG